jgi:hypothetical protein
MAKRRLADEYDAAQERGDAASQGRPKKGSQAKPFLFPVKCRSARQSIWRSWLGQRGLPTFLA